MHVKELSEIKQDNQGKDDDEGNGGSSGFSPLVDDTPLLALCKWSQK